MSNRLVVAICYDFDKTLSPKDMQEYALFDKLGVESADFWKESNDNAKRNKMDKILSYMHLIVKKSQENDQTVTINKRTLKNMGKSVELFSGLDTWFDRVNIYAEENNISVEHYIISAGLQEIIEGTPISGKFHKIFASSFLFNANGIPTWPKQVVNYTQKTQYLFRISKNCLDLSDEDGVNKEISNEERRIPFRNIIYIGDSETDIPAMKVVKKNGGTSIGIYNPYSSDVSKVLSLVRDSRIGFFAPADYSPNSIIEKYIKLTLNKIRANDEIIAINDKQETLSKYSERMTSHIREISGDLEDSIDTDGLRDVYNYFRQVIKRVFKDIGDNYKGEYFVDQDVLNSFEKIKIDINEIYKKKQKQLKKLEKSQKPVQE